ncbi:MAG: hypothetical protein OEY14_12180, partial [Myxococcales bacterium]|nr:hypothetical protein [Myxococcales bacterium]
SARAPAPGSPWWEHLAADFSERDEAFELALRDSLQVRASAASDVVLRSVAASMVGALALPLGYHPLRLRSAERDRAFYGPIAAAGDARRFFRDPPKGVRVRSRRARFFPGFDPEDGEAEELSFDSPFVPVNPAQHRDYLKHRHNRTAHARLWRHRGSEARPTIMAIHGFTADLSLLNEWFFALPWFYRMGCDVLLFTLPFHGARRMNGSLFSGHGYFAGGPSRINEAVAQSVMDFRIFRDWLEQERGVRQVGVTGVSLGGFTTAAIATVEERLCFAIPNVPVISLADLVLEWEPMGTVVRSLLRLTGRRIEDARHMLAASCPLSYAPALARERLMIVGGVGDRLAPPKHSRILWDHWGRCRIHWFPGSHLLHLDRGDYLRQIARFLAGIGFLPRPE